MFVGRVESVEPDLDFWSYSSTSGKLNPELSELQNRLKAGDDSAGMVKKLREVYLQMVPTQYRRAIMSAATARELQGIWGAALENGKRVRLTVEVTYKGPRVPTLDVWTDFSDCATYLMKGETYLLYAQHGEKSRLETGACSGNSRLTDAGEDLAYLHFILHGGSAAGRVYGFVTSNENDLRLPRLWWSVPDPIPDLFLRLQSERTTRYATTNRHGEFALDGLEKGKYSLSVFGKDFPEKEQLLSGPRKVAVPLRGCVSENFFIPDIAHKTP